MRRSRARPCRVVAGAILIATGLGAAPSVAQEHPLGPLVIPVDHARVITLSAKAAVVLIADPEVADVVNERNNLMFVIAHKPGSTNLLVYDNAGKRLFEREVLVTGPDSGTVTITRQTDQTNYVCNPRCSAGDAAAAPPPSSPPPPSPSAIAAPSPPAR